MGAAAVWYNGGFVGGGMTGVMVGRELVGDGITGVNVAVDGTGVNVAVNCLVAVGGNTCVWDAGL